MAQIAQAAAEIMVENPKATAGAVSAGAGAADYLLFDPYSQCGVGLTTIRFLFTMLLGVGVPWFVLSVNWLTLVTQGIELGIKGVSLLTVIWTFRGLLIKRKRARRTRQIKKKRNQEQ